MEKFLRVNMNTGTIKKEEVPDNYKNLGGRVLSSALIANETDPKCDPLGKDNKLVICTGLLGATSAPSSGRLSVGGKSPLTGGLKEANAGGVVAKQLCKLGIKAIILEEKSQSDDWYMLRITDQSVELLPAGDLVGLNNYALTEKLMNKYGDKIGIVSIGVAGERGYLTSTLQVTSTNGYPSRSAARGGLGAVMGSKGLKAIVVDVSGPKSTQYADKEKFMEANKRYIKGISDHPVSGSAMPALGTAVLVNGVNAGGALPTNNFSMGTFAGAEKISGEKIAELQAQRGGKIGHACNPGCVIKCSNHYLDKDGNYLTSGFEYETIGLLGSNCGIDDIDAIAGMDRICDDLGVDTMDIGVALGVCMEAGKAAFGDVNGAFAIFKEMEMGTDFGRIVGNGAEYAGKSLKVKRIPTVKNQALAAYDPRAVKGVGVTYATSPMGADHTAGNTFGDPNLNPTGKEGQVETSGALQVATATFDSLGMCIFASFCTADPQMAEAVAELMTYYSGDKWSVDRVFGLGVETLKIEKRYNRQAGITDDADRLPEFMYREALDPTGAIFDFTDEELAKAVPF